MHSFSSDLKKIVFIFDDILVSLEDIVSTELSAPCHVIDFSFSLQSLKEVFACLYFNHSFLILDSNWPRPFKHKHIEMIRSFDFRNPVFFIVTSGSTAAPKLVCHHLSSLSISAKRALAQQSIKLNDCFLLSLPAFSMGGLLTIVKSFISNAVLYASAIHWSTLISNISNVHGTFVPQQIQTLFNLESVDFNIFSSILVGGDALPQHIITKIKSLNLPIIYSYGLTETCGQVIATKIGHLDNFRLLDDVNVSYDDQQLMIDVPTTAIGYLTPDGLLNLPRKNSFFLTNDIVTPLPEFKLIGRKDFQFQSGSKLVSPELIETELLKSLIVDEIIVIPKPDKKFTYVPIAFVSKHADVNALAHYSEQYLPKFMRPNQYLVLPDNLNFDDILCRKKLLQLKF